MFNTSRHNSQTHNGGPPGWPYIGFADTRQRVLGFRNPLVEADSRQIIQNDSTRDARTRQVVFAVVLEETHVIQT